MKKQAFVLILFLFSGIFHQVQAQFEGEINFRIYNPEESNEATNLDLTFTKDRIFISSNSSMDVMSGVSTDGILVRNDHQDFIFMTGENEALQIKKSDLDGLMNLMNRMQGNNTDQAPPSFEWDKKVVETGNTRTIQGFEANEFVLTREEENEEISVWLTDQIKVDWGLLQSAWETTGSKQVGEEVPIELVMNRNSFPLFVEVTKDNEIVFRAESVQVNSNDFDRSKTEIASGTSLMGFTDLMMNMFRQRR